MLILSLDPSLSSTGYAVIESDTKKLVCKGKINTSAKDPTDDRIEQIITKLSFLPESSHVILEDGFIGKNAKTGLQLSELRGAIIFYFRQQKRTVVHQLPSEIRKNFGLPGNSKKEQVAEEVLKYYQLATQIVGKEQTTNQFFRIGASRLTNRLYAFLTE